MSFLYPLVAEWFNEMRMHGKFVNCVGLLEHFVHVLETFVSDAEKRGYDAARPEDQLVL